MYLGFKTIVAAKLETSVSLSSVYSQIVSFHVKCLVAVTKSKRL